MRIPNVPHDNIAKSSGHIGDAWASFFSNLITQMRLNLSDEGYVVPFLSNEDILELSNSENIGKILYNTTTSKMMINNSGIFENIQV